MDGGLQRVIDRFPQLAASIRDRFDDDQSFRDMCHDYAEAWKRWSGGRHRTAHGEPLASRSIASSPARWRSRSSPRCQRLPRCRRRPEMTNAEGSASLRTASALTATAAMLGVC